MNKIESMQTENHLIEQNTFSVGGLRVEVAPFDYGRFCREISARKAVIFANSRHREFVRYDRHGEFLVASDNAHNCLSGFVCLNEGIFILHDPPLKILVAPIGLPKGVVLGGILGGGHDHWESVQDKYTETCRGVTPMYLPKPEGHKRNPDFSFAFLINMKTRTVKCGYYYNPKGPGGDGWNWDD